METKNQVKNMIKNNIKNEKKGGLNSEERSIKIMRLVMRFAGAFIIISVVLAYLHSLYWLLFTLFVGLNLFQYSFTKFCPLEIILNKVVK